jgi:hypothetical protein
MNGKSTSSMSEHEDKIDSTKVIKLVRSSDSGDRETMS